MKESFLNYLKHHVPEYDQYLKRYSNPGLKRINKMVNGEKFDVSVHLIRETVSKKKDFFFVSDFDDIKHFNSYYNYRINEIEKELKDNTIEPFVKITGFELGYNCIIIKYDTVEHEQDYKKRLRENERRIALNDMIPIIQDAARDFEEHNQQKIEENRKLVIQKKIEALQRELENLGD